MIDYLIILSFFYFGYILFKNLGKGFPIFELTIVLYLLQYCVAALFLYRNNIETVYKMPVPDFQYLPFALFSCLAFAAGLYIYKPKINIQNLSISPKFASILGRVMLAIGMISSFMMPFLPASIGTILNFFAMLTPSGVYALVFSNKKIDKVLVIVFSIKIAASAILGGLLIGFIIYAIFLYLFLNLKYKISNTLKLVAIASSLVFLVVYQNIKHEYRAQVWDKELTAQEKVAVLQSLVSLNTVFSLFESDIKHTESYNSTMVRLNQGWQTARVLNHVPRVTPYQNGKALLNDIFSSFLPRALVPDKRIVNDRNYFYKYTGHKLNSRTAMSIGVLGDFYINFGYFWSIPALFIFGTLMAKLLTWLYYRFIIDNPVNLIWIPYIFNYFIRPGNEFYFAFNHLIKALFIFYIVRKFIYPYLSRKLRS